MKRLILLAFAALTLFSCSKGGDGNEPEPEIKFGTILLKRITDVSESNPYITMELTYNDKQLTKASYGKRGNGNFAYEHVFTYNSQGQLTTMNAVSVNSTTYKKAEIYYSGNNISEVNFTLYDNTRRRVLYTYSNGRVITERIDFPNASNDTHETTYTYDASGRNTKQQYTHASIGPNGLVTQGGYYDYITFDDKKNVISALPNWVYFRADSYNLNGLDNGFGNNNPLTGKHYDSGGTYPTNETYTFSYTYNAYGYPATMTMKDNTGYTRSYTYDYIEVK